MYPGTCSPPEAKFVGGRNVIPRKQWGDSGGFCGSSSIQTIAMSYDAWISQDLIRKAAPDNVAGHGNEIEGYEILHNNIEGCLDNLKLTYSPWDYEAGTK